ncbi:adenylate kinase family protein [Nanoarchaeota archaeon]
MKIILIGPQGSGKGVQSEILSKKWNIPAISVGMLFREEIKNQTEFGKEYQEMYKKGILAPDEKTIELLEKRLEKDDCKNGFIIDGYPRTLNQAKLLKKEIDVVIFLVVPDEISVERISSRKECEDCGDVYGKNIKPKKEDICDECGGKIRRRDDDEPEVVKNRLKIYHNNIKPILEYYEVRGLLIKIDGSGDIEEVSKEIILRVTSKKEVDKNSSVTS